MISEVYGRSCSIGFTAKLLGLGQNAHNPYGKGIETIEYPTALKFDATIIIIIDHSLKNIFALISCQNRIGNKVLLPII